MKFIKILLKIILSIVLVLSTVGFIMLSVLQTTLLNERFIDRKIINQEYKDAVYNTVISDIEEKSLSVFPEWTKDVFVEAVSISGVSEYSEEYIRSLHLSVLKDTEIENDVFESEELYNAIKDKYESLEEADGGEPAEDVVMSLYEKLCATVTANVHVVGDNLINKVPSVQEFVPIFDALQYVLLAIIPLSALLIIVLDIKKWEKGLYLAMTMTWMGSALTLIPMVMLKFYDLPGRLVVNIPGIKVIIKNIVDLCLGRGMIISGSVLAVSTALLILSIVFILRRSSKEDKKRQV